MDLQLTCIVCGTSLEGYNVSAKRCHGCAVDQKRRVAKQSSGRREERLRTLSARDREQLRQAAALSPLVHHVVLQAVLDN